VHVDENLNSHQRNLGTYRAWVENSERGPVGRGAARLPWIGIS